jgi:hypothetical protein
MRIALKAYRGETRSYVDVLTEIGAERAKEWDSAKT